MQRNLGLNHASLIGTPLKLHMQYFYHDIEIASLPFNKVSKVNETDLLTFCLVASQFLVCDTSAAFSICGAKSHSMFPVLW